MHKPSQLGKPWYLHNEISEDLAIDYFKMGLLSLLSCGSCGKSQVSPGSPQLQSLAGVDSRTSAALSPVPHLYPVQAFPSKFGRPRVDIIQKPKRSRAFPVSFGKSSWVKIGTVSGVRTRGRIEALFDLICNLIDDHVENDDPPALWLAHIRELLKTQNIGAALEEARKDNPGWKNSTPCLTTFVRDHAPQLFAMLLYTESIYLIDRFCEKRMRDKMFPVKLSVKTKSIESAQGDPPIKLEFGSQVRVRDIITLFGDWQWQFFAPELHWAPFEGPAFDSKCRLPFLAPLNEIGRTDFSILFTTVVHRNYIAIESNDFVSSLIKLPLNNPIY